MLEVIFPHGIILIFIITMAVFWIGAWIGALMNRIAIEKGLSILHTVIPMSLIVSYLAYAAITNLVLRTYSGN